MPKIPTFISDAQMTTKASSVRTNIQASMKDSPLTALEPAISEVNKYYLKQRDIREKTEAKKKALEVFSEADSIVADLENNSNEEEALSIFNEKFNTILNTKLGTTDNARIKSLLQNTVDINLPKKISAIKTNSRNALELDMKITHDNDQNILANEYLFADTEGKKIILDQAINNEIGYSNDIGLSKIATQENVDKVKQSYFISDVNNLIKNKQYAAANEMLKNVKDSPFLDFEERTKLLAEVQEGFNDDIDISIYNNVFENGQGSIAVGAGFNLTRGKKVNEKGLEETANRYATATDANGELIYTTAQVIELANKNNTKVPLYYETLDGGGNITDTSNPDATKMGLQLYQTFKNQNALQSLTSIYKLDKSDLATYQRLDFAMNTMKQTFDQAYTNELKYKNDPDKYKLLKVDGKAVTDKVNELDFPGVTPFKFGLEFENEAYAAQIIKNVANNVMIATGSEKGSLDFAKKYVEDNYRVDDFGQLVPINNIYPEYHDQAVKLYIKDLYDSGRINKEQHELEDIIPVYFNAGSLTSNQGFVLRDKNTGVPISIDIVDPTSDFDEGSYDKARMTYKDIVEKIYPLMKDVRYEEFVDKYNRIQKQKQEFDIISEMMP